VRCLSTRFAGVGVSQRLSFNHALPHGISPGTRACQMCENAAGRPQLWQHVARPFSVCEAWSVSASLETVVTSYRDIRTCR
jgi:hypothetical protein